jgi:ribosomal protein L40E
MFNRPQKQEPDKHYTWTERIDLVIGATSPTGQPVITECPSLDTQLCIGCGANNLLQARHCDQCGLPLRYE